MRLHEDLIVQSVAIRTGTPIKCKHRSYGDERRVTQLQQVTTLMSALVRDLEYTMINAVSPRTSLRRLLRHDGPSKFGCTLELM